MAPEPDDGPDRFAGEDELLARDEHVRDVAARAARVLRIAEAEQPGARELAVERARELLGFFPRVRVRSDVALGELAGLRAERRVLVGLEEVRGHRHDNTTRSRERSR